MDMSSLSPLFLVGELTSVRRTGGQSCSPLDLKEIWLISSGPSYNTVTILETFFHNRTYPGSAFQMSPF